VVLSVFTRGSSYMDAEAGEAVIADTGRTVYDYFLLTGR
jgi:hypothetical protein